MNYGTGSIHQEKTKTVAECCQLCADNSECKAWDWNPSSSNCYEKDNSDLHPGATCPGNLCRYSGKMPSKDNSTGVDAAVAVLGPPAPPPGDHRMTGHPPESTTAFDDSAWDLVDTPHDMLINQKFDGSNTKGMAYLPRNNGWYRKHFKLPVEWSGKSVWMYCEGSFHATTAFLNGADIGFHQAGYTSFWLRLDNVTGVHYGATENVLALYIDASFGTGWWYEVRAECRTGAVSSRTNDLRRRVFVTGRWTHSSSVPRRHRHHALRTGRHMVLRCRHCSGEECDG